jgi:hypothetical protein
MDNPFEFWNMSITCLSKNVKLGSPMFYILYFMFIILHFASFNKKGRDEIIPPHLLFITKRSGQTAFIPVLLSLSPVTNV